MLHCRHPRLLGISSSGQHINSTKCLSIPAHYKTASEYHGLHWGETRTLQENLRVKGGAWEHIERISRQLVHAKNPDNWLRGSGHSARALQNDLGQPKKPPGLHREPSG